MSVLKTLELTWSHGAYRVSVPNYLKEGERVSLIELEPVLDLLEPMARLEMTGTLPDFQPLADFLRSHDRLRDHRP